VKLQAAA
jgi:hypothetical protein